MAPQRLHVTAPVAQRLWPLQWWHSGCDRSSDGTTAVATAPAQVRSGCDRSHCAQRLVTAPTQVHSGCDRSNARMGCDRSSDGTTAVDRANASAVVTAPVMAQRLWPLQCKAQRLWPLQWWHSGSYTAPVMAPQRLWPLQCKCGANFFPTPNWPFAVSHGSSAPFTKCIHRLDAAGFLVALLLETAPLDAAGFFEALLLEAAVFAAGGALALLFEAAAFAAGGALALLLDLASCNFAGSLPRTTAPGWTAESSKYSWILWSQNWRPTTLPIFWKLMLPIPCCL